MATKKKNNLLNGIAGINAGNVAAAISGAVKGAASGIANGKTPGSVINDVKSSSIGPVVPAGALAGAVTGGLGPFVSGTTPTNNGGGYSQQVEMPVNVRDLPTYNSEYMDQLNALARQLTSMNYDDWTKGSQYQALAERYGQNGRLSMQDVLGQVASRTGGLASSYATTAAQQQYNQYMAQLEEVARQMYSQDRNDLLDSANLYRNLANDEYDRYRDRVSDYNQQLAAAQAAARSAYSGSTASSKKISSGGSDGGRSGLDNYNAVKNNILMYADRGMDAVSNRLINQAWGQMSSTQQKDLMNTLRKKGWA